jgi:hypothetical protein
MLSEGERRALQEIEQHLLAEADQTRVTVRRGAPRRLLRVFARCGAGGALLLLVVGVPAAAFSVGAATASVWLLCRYWAQLSDAGDTAVTPPSAERLRRRAERRRRRRDLAEYLWRKAGAE